VSLQRLYELCWICAAVIVQAVLLEESVKMELRGWRRGQSGLDFDGGSEQAGANKVMELGGLPTSPRQ